MKKGWIWVLVEGIVISICYFLLKSFFSQIGNEQVGTFIFIASMLGLSTGSVLVIHEENRITEILHILSLYYVYKTMILMFLFSVGMLKCPLPFIPVNVSIQLIGMNLWASLWCYVCIFKGVRRDWITLIMCAGFVMFTIGSNCFPVKSTVLITGYLIIFLEMLLVVVRILSIIVLNKIFMSKSLQSRHCFYAFVGCEIIYLFILGNSDLDSVRQLDTLPLLFSMLEVYYLFKTTYVEFFKEPWKKKMAELTKAQHKLKNNAYNRDVIVNLSHELKTPINVINSATELLRLDFEENEEAMNDIKSMRRYCSRILQMVKNVIDLHKLEGGYIILKSEKYNLVELMDVIVDAYTQEYPDLQIIFDPEEEEIFESVDKSYIERIFLYFIYILLVKKQNEDEIYIEMQRNNQFIEITFSHPYVKDTNEYIISPNVMRKQLEQEQGIVGIMNMKLIEILLKQQKGYVSVDYEGKGISIRIIFEVEDVNVKGEEKLMEENEMDVLREVIRSYGATN